jgi:hypothetical protein
MQKRDDLRDAEHEHEIEEQLDEGDLLIVRRNEGGRHASASIHGHSYRPAFAPVASAGPP